MSKLAEVFFFGSLGLSLRGLAGFLFNHLLSWLDFKLRLSRVFQIELNRAQDFTVQGTVVLERAFPKRFKELIIVFRETYHCSNHDNILVARCYLVNPQFLAVMYA